MTRLTALASPHPVEHDGTEQLRATPESTTNTAIGPALASPFSTGPYRTCPSLTRALSSLAALPLTLTPIAALT